MSRSASWCLIALVLLANVLGTLCYSGAGPVDDLSRAYAGPLGRILQTVFDLLTLPVATRGIADIRDVALLLPLGLAGLLLMVEHPPGSAPTLRLPSAIRWLIICGGGVVMLSLLSAATNRSFDLSWGWIIRTSAGVAWAVLLAQYLNEWACRRAIVGLLVLATLGLALTLADRAESELAHFRRPLGPITVTAALAAVWAAMAGGYLVMRLPEFERWIRTRFRRGQSGSPVNGPNDQPPEAEVSPLFAAAAQASRRSPAPRPASILSVILLAGVAVLAGYVLQQTGRRAAAMGLIGGLLVAVCLLAWVRVQRRAMKAILLALPVLAAAAACVYVIGQMHSPVREVSGSLDLRLAYWRLSAELIGERPLCGVGPDRFVVAMTDRVSPLRAVSPHFFHGNMDLYAHNEWLQAAVELGVPAALVWLLLPVGIVWIAARRLRELAALPASSDGLSVMVVPLCAGLGALLLTDCGSIVLRTPILLPWYWTLAGLLAAALRLTEPQPAGASAARAPRARTTSVTAALWAAVGLSCLFISVRELSRSVHEQTAIERAAFPMPARLCADKTLTARYGSGLAVLRQVAERRADAAAALPPWAALHRQMAALHDTPAMYAQALLLNGRTDEARFVLERSLQNDGNPTNLAANVLYARLRTDDAVEQMKCVQRALRNSAMEGDLRDLASRAVAGPGGREWLEVRLPEARRAAADDDPGGDAAASSDVELLRIQASLLEETGRVDSAIAELRIAAECYRRLEKTNHRARRGSEAETDAFYTLARMLYAADAGNYPAALDAIRAAEYYAVLGVAHERRAVPEPEAGFVWGEVVPTEFPERLYDLWRLSALLHVMAGRDLYLDGRIFSSLPPERRTMADLNRELARLARQAHADLGRLPSEQRPPHYARLADMVHRYEASPP